MRYLELFLGISVCLAACTADDRQAGGDGQVPIMLTTSVRSAGGQTRAGTDVESAQLLRDEKFLVYFAGDAATVASAVYTADGSGGASTAVTPCFKTTAVSATLHAYHPSTVTETTPTFSVQQDQTTDVGYLASDLLYATTTLEKSGASVTGNLSFTHLLSKLVVRVTAGDGVSAITSVRVVGGYRTVALGDRPALTLGALSNANTTSNYITMYEGSGTEVSCAALLPPQTVSGKFLQVMTNAGPLMCALDGKVFASGHTYTLSLTVNRTAIAMETIVLSGWDDGTSVTGTFPKYDVPAHAPTGAEPVDLGLPSGTLWANMNVGASSVTDHGSYFAWGETFTKEAFAWSTYWWGTSDALTKYNSTDRMTILEKGDDAAYISWGGSWRMPTEAECQELIDNCTWTWQSNYNGSGIYGYLLTGPSGHAIFLPVTGRGEESGVMYVPNASGAGFWSNTMGDSPANAKYMYFRFNDTSGIGSNLRSYGYTVRPVMSKPQPQAVDLGLSVLWANMNVDANFETDYGSYFAFADTEGYRFCPSTPESASKYSYIPIDGNPFNWASYKWYVPGGDTVRVSKYHSGASNKMMLWGGAGAADLKTVIEPEDDAAHVKWGDGWRIPSRAELEELIGTYNNKTSYTWTRYTASPGYKNSGHAGWEVEYKPTGAKVFFLAAGRRIDGYIGSVGVTVYLHQNEISVNVITHVMFEGSSAKVILNGQPRYIGLPIRAVKAK